MIVTHEGKEIAEAVFLEKQDGMCQNTYILFSMCLDYEHYNRMHVRCVCILRLLTSIGVYTVPPSLIHSKFTFMLEIQLFPCSIQFKLPIMV